jgi:cytochrome b6-f complex iron-sulfur subunit
MAGRKGCRWNKMNGEKDSNPNLTSRRNVLKGLLTSLGAFGLGGILYGIYGYLARGEGAASPVEILLSDLPQEGPYHFQYGGVPGMLMQEENGDWGALSLVCTHLGCTVIWKPEKKEFHCPCHDGLFDSQGRVISGPPPSPLERLRVKVIGEKVVIG